VSSARSRITRRADGAGFCQSLTSGDQDFPTVDSKAQYFPAVKLRRMSCKHSRNVITGLSAGSAVLTSQANIANTVASFFPTACSSDNYDADFRATKGRAQTFPLNSTPRVAESYDVIFTMDDVIAGLDCGRSTCPGLMVSITKCCHSFHPQARSFGCLHTTACGRRAWCRMPAKKLPSSLF
jgi:hypothetical protein